MQIDGLFPIIYRRFNLLSFYEKGKIFMNFAVPAKGVSNYKKEISSIQNGIHYIQDETQYNNVV